tara:strand:+ start:350 stop:556 length:207 start_codon:yes stop_codon:yes gene_type:complete
MNNNKSNSKTASKIKKLAIFLEKNLLLEEKKNIITKFANKNNNKPAGISTYSNIDDNSQLTWINSLRS